MILIKNGTLIDPYNNRNEKIDLEIQDGVIHRIAHISTEELDHAYESIIDAEGCIVAPGLIDVHVHFRDPGFTHKEDIYTGALSAIAGGFTAVICMANTKPIVDNVETLSYIQEKAAQCGIHVLQSAAITKSFRGTELVDMRQLKESGAVGFTDDGIAIKDSKLVYEAMELAKELDVPLSFHEEDSAFITEPGVNQGVTARKLGLTGADSLSEEIMIARDCMIALKTGATINIQHISSGNSLDLVRFAKQKGAHVIAEVTPHHFSLCEEDVLTHGTLAKMNPPLRTKEDRAQIINALKDNTIEIIATDHAPHSTLEKAVNFTQAPSGIIGLETSLALGITNLVRPGHITLSQLLEKMTINPAQLYHLPYGTLTEGSSADIVIFNPDETYTVGAFASKASNSPFIGQSLYGVVKYTICEGNILHS